jgi:hypothetical protein
VQQQFIALQAQQARQIQKECTYFRMAAATKSLMTGDPASPIEVDDDDEVIDDEQLEEYREEVEQLGSFPVSGFLLMST